MCNDDGTTADHDRGLGHDLETLHAQQDRALARRRGRRAVLGLLGAGAAVGGGALILGAGGADAQQAGSSSASCATEIPNETAGPYPGDGSNGPDALAEAGIVRRDLRRSFGDADGTVSGVPFTFQFTLQNTATCKPVKGLAVYAWHCTPQGEYSMYSSGIEDENYLRGVQVTNVQGKVTFTSIVPGCYSGRWPHVHFEVYASRYAATHDGVVLATSQLAIPRKQAMQVYRGDDRYSGSEENLDRISLRSDMVFGDDGGARQLATTTGSVADGYVARLVVPVDV